MDKYSAYLRIRGGSMSDDEFAEMVEEKMGEIGDNLAFRQEGDQFAVWFGSEILGFPINDVADEYHIGGAGDEKIDIGICEQDIPLKTIVQCKFSSGGSELFDEAVIDEIIRAKTKLVDCSTGNSKRQLFCQKYMNSSKPERLLVAGFGRFNDAAYRYALAENIVIYDITRIRNEWYVRNDPTRLPGPDLISLPIDSEDVIKRERNAHGVILTVISTKKIFDLIEEHGLRLFGENFRYKLPNSARSDEIAQDIQKTLEIYSERMLQRNNGLTFTAERVEINGDKLDLVKPQIVNGCQTSYAIHEWYKQRSEVQDLDDLPEGELSVKIIVSELEEAKAIARSANRQNPIRERDLHSNDNEQIQLAAEFKTLSKPVFYETREGGWAAIIEKNETRTYRVPGLNRERRITNEGCAQISLALFGIPHYSKDRKREIWINPDIYRAIFGLTGGQDDRMDTIETLTRIPQILDFFKCNSQEFIEDCLFGYGILSLLDAMKRKQLKEKRELLNVSNPIAAVVDKKSEYYKYWDYHFLGVCNYVIWSICDGDRSRIRNARKDLIGDDVNLYFSTPMRKANKFKVLRDTSFHDILDADLTDRNIFGHFSAWLNTIDKIFFDLIEEAEGNNEFKNFNHFFYKTPDTFKKAIDKAARIFGSQTGRSAQFPLP